MNVYHRKLYALVRSLEAIDWLGTDVSYIYNGLTCLAPHLEELRLWWENLDGKIGTSISSSSDRVNLNSTAQPGQMDNIAVRHPISGQEQTITVSAFNRPIDISKIAAESDEKKVFWWFWRYFAEELAHLDPKNALLIPTHRILPDCPLHSYQSTVSALTGAIFADGKESNEAPYLLLFTFSPVQEFIKSSRKFLDFWAGSFLLHYFSALLCFEAAQNYGPDAVITPSLWNQEIIDAFLIQEYPEFREKFQQSDNDPTAKFQNNPESQSLSTAGFPNVITVLVPNQKSATELGKKLDNFLKMRWLEMSQKVRGCIKSQVIKLLDNENKIEEIWNDISDEFPNSGASDLKKELRQFHQQGCWEWNKLWDVQIENTWETYFVAVPFGHPEKPLEIDTTNLNKDQRQDWIKLQNEIARPIIDLPSQAEQQAYTKLNVGSLWGSLQARLGNTIQAVKNTRAWQIPVAPGERSTLSGQYSAVHPRFVYQQFPNGFGMPSESLRLFWRVMGLAFPGLFNGSEKLNAIELTKRMAWKHGGVAESLGIPLNDNDDDYEGLIRFPNLSSIAAAHFATHHPEKIEKYWNDLEREISINTELKSKHDIFWSRTRRPFQVKRADVALRERTNYGNGYNGVMFSSKWLADDMNLNRDETNGLRTVNALRTVIDRVQKQHFGDSSPADWWVLVLGDGDGMGNYVNGRKLKFYQDYLVSDLLDTTNIPDEDLNELLDTRKRMGPATHIGLNRALLDFSNRLVPYITEQRFCGRVIYSGGDDVMAALPLADLPGFLRSLRAAWCGAKDPEGEFISRGGYWQWDTENSNKKPNPGDIPPRPLFTMGEEATMSLGIVIAHKSVPLPTVLEKLWDAEKEGAKKLIGGVIVDKDNPKQERLIPHKDGLCFRVIYGSGNTLEAFMKGHLLEDWWNFIQISQQYETLDLTPVLYRLASELPRHAEITADDKLFQKVAQVVLSSRNEELPQRVEDALLNWLDAWEEWARSANQTAKQRQIQEEGSKPKDIAALGGKPEDIAMLLRFTAFWVSKQIF
jgi:CRISPR-associated protein Cmr2